MKINVNSELSGTECLDYFLAELEKQGFKATKEEIKCEVFSEKTQKFINFEPSNVKFIYSK